MAGRTGDTTRANRRISRPKDERLSHAEMIRMDQPPAGVGAVLSGEADGSETAKSLRRATARGRPAGPEKHSE